MHAHLLPANSELVPNAVHTEVVPARAATTTNTAAADLEPIDLSMVGEVLVHSQLQLLSKLLVEFL